MNLSKYYSNKFNLICSNKTNFNEANWAVIGHTWIYTRAYF